MHVRLHLQVVVIQMPFREITLSPVQLTGLLQWLARKTALLYLWKKREYNYFHFTASSTENSWLPKLENRSWIKWWIRFSLRANKLIPDQNFAATSNDRVCSIIINMHNCLCRRTVVGYRGRNASIASSNSTISSLKLALRGIYPPNKSHSCVMIRPQWLWHITDCLQSCHAKWCHVYGLQQIE